MGAARGASCAGLRMGELRHHERVHKAPPDCRNLAAPSVLLRRARAGLLLCRGRASFGGGKLSSAPAAGGRALLLGPSFVRGREVSSAPASNLQLRRRRVSSPAAGGRAASSVPASDLQLRGRRVSSPSTSGLRRAPRALAEFNSREHRERDREVI